MVVVVVEKNLVGGEKNLVYQISLLQSTKWLMTLSTPDHMYMVKSWRVYRTKDSPRDGRVFIVDGLRMVVVTERCV